MVSARLVNFTGILHNVCRNETGLGRPVQSGGTQRTRLDRKNDPMLTNSDTQVINRYCDEVLNDGDFTAATEILAPDFVIHGLQTLRGRERFLEVQSTIRKAFPDLTVDVEDMFGDENNVAVRSTMRGTHRGEYLGIAATGRQVAVESMMICRLSGGRIVEVWAQMDSLSWFQQLEAVPPMEWQEAESTPTDQD